jgi:iron(III) transport system substrate-binding protein
MTRFAFSLLILSSMVLAGCSRSDKTNTLTIYSSMDESMTQKLTQAFKEETGIHVEFVRLTTGEAAARIEAEKSNPQASLWLGGVGLGHGEVKAKGLTTPYNSPAATKIPKDFRDPENHWTGIYTGVLVFVSNSEQLKKKNLEAPTSWKALAEARFKGQIQLPNPATSGTSYNLITALVLANGEDKAFDYLKALHQNISQYTKSGAAPTKNVALGESVVAVGYQHDSVRLAEESKAPLLITYPSEGTGFEIAPISMLKNGTTPELGQKFFDWIFSPKASQIMADFYYVPLLREGVKIQEKALPPKGLKLIDVPVDWAGENKQRLIDLWNVKINT